jgi:hypothetical protein
MGQSKVKFYLSNNLSNLNLETIFLPGSAPDGTE